MSTVTIDSTMGAAFIGVVVAAILHGISCVQAWYYFTHQRDPWHIVLLVVAVMVFDTVHQALISHTVYTYLITNYNSVDILSSLVWSLLVEVLFNGFTAFLVQTFLTMRVWRLSNHNSYVTLLIASLVAAEFACILAFGALSLQLSTFLQLENLKALSVSVNALAAAGDVLIAATLCILLHKSRTGFQRSDTIINKLILFAVNTGVLTSLCAIASLISILIAPNTFIYITFFFCMGRLYTNSLLATLNARKMIRSVADDGTSVSLSLRDFGSHSQNHTGRLGIRSKASIIGNGRTARPNISIQIDTTKECTVDQNSALDMSSLSPSAFALQNSFIDEKIGITIPSRDALNLEKGIEKPARARSRRPQSPIMQSSGLFAPLRPAHRMGQSTIDHVPLSPSLTLTNEDGDEEQSMPTSRIV